MSVLDEFSEDVPDYISEPPIECVVFGWGANEDGYGGDDCSLAPRVIESLLGSRLRGRALGRRPLVAELFDQNGSLWSWGWNDRGTLGRENKTDGKTNSPAVPLKNTTIVQAAIGGWHCLAVDTKGKVFAWGGNECKQCADHIAPRDVFVPTPIVSNLTVRQVACGGMHSLALTTDGNVWTWGEPWGDFSLAPERTVRCVRKTGDTIIIACGAFHNMALDKQGQIYTWGINDYGQLGNGSTFYSTSPSRVVDLDNTVIVDISAGGWHSTAVSNKGELWVWGRGEYGRLGLGDGLASSRLRPCKVEGLEQHYIVQASAGGTHTMCLTKEGIVFTWGRGSYGRLGDKEPNKDRYSPQRLDLPGGRHQWRVLSIACGGRHSLCLALPAQNEVRLLSFTDDSGEDEEQSETDDESSHDVTDF